MERFDATIAYRGKAITVSAIDVGVTGSALYEKAFQEFELSPREVNVKLLLKGKKIEYTETVVFSEVPRKSPKILVLASPHDDVSKLNSQRSDPLIRGFDQEKEREERLKNHETQSAYWGPGSGQDKNYKFSRLEECDWQSFGHRAGEKAPHSFVARQLLEKLASDPGIVAIMKERELVVGTLGEMDPIDDRIMQKLQSHGNSCLLGYNTNAGLRIDIKLRTEDLQSFRPYTKLVETLIHELSHNWVGDHNLLFWTNYGQMRAEYLHTHMRLRSTLVGGKNSAELAGLDSKELDNVYEFLMQELQIEMAQHQLHPNMIASPILQRCKELEQTHGGERLGGRASRTGSETQNNRELALAAAERRARKQKDRDGKMK